VAFSFGEQHAALSTDNFMNTPPAINIVGIADDSADQSGEVVQQLSGFSKRISRVAFTDLNAVLISAGEDGIVRRWDIEVSAFWNL
jgi:translation initiation factor 3 subunit I